jgi:hypothetical protein
MNLPCKKVLSEREGTLLMTMMSGRVHPNAWAVCMNQRVFVIVRILQKFDRKNRILTDTKDFSWEKRSTFAKFRKEK